MTSHSDVNYFASIMEPSALPSTTNYTTPQSMLSDASDRLASVTQRMTKSLRALSGENKFDEARKYPEQLSDTLLLTQMLVKSVGKTAQGIDKICNLQ
ncbi:MAG: hypothetical protein ACRC1I_12640 [Pseudomonas proteolytica]|uniref:hypothetical protein n=1 Tax=Pseudomonas proteolytica TaxID=219574 RepID=UPI003F3DA572